MLAWPGLETWSAPRRTEILYAAQSSLIQSFNPATDTGGTLVRLYNADDLTKLYTTSGKSTAVAANNDPVGAWSSGVGATALDLLQATAGRRPLFKLGYFGTGRNAVLFDGVDDFLRDDATTVTAQSYTVAMLYQQVAIGASRVIVDRAGGSGSSVRVYNNSASLAMTAGTVVNIATATTEVKVLLATFNGASSIPYLNNVAQIAATDAGSNSWTGWTMGGDRTATNSANWSNVAIGRALLYTGTLTAQDRYNIYFYLANGATLG